MNIEIQKHEKNDLEIKIDNITIAEILRVYLNKNGVKFAAWRREHPTKPVLLKVQSADKSVKREINEAINAIQKDLNNLKNLFKK